MSRRRRRALNEWQDPEYSKYVYYAQRIVRPARRRTVYRTIYTGEIVPKYEYDSPIDSYIIYATRKPRRHILHRPNETREERNLRRRRRRQQRQHKIPPDFFVYSTIGLTVERERGGKLPSDAKRLETLWRTDEGFRYHMHQLYDDIEYNAFGDMEEFKDNANRYLTPEGYKLVKRDRQNIAYRHMVDEYTQLPEGIRENIAHLVSTEYLSRRVQNFLHG